MTIRIGYAVFEAPEGAPKEVFALESDSAKRARIDEALKAAKAYMHRCRHVSGVGSLPGGFAREHRDAAFALGQTKIWLGGIGRLLRGLPQRPPGWVPGQRRRLASSPAALRAPAGRSRVRPTSCSRASQPDLIQLYKPVHRAITRYSTVHNGAMSAYEDLDARLLASKSAPFLFVGAGLSRRYLNIDGWAELLKRMAAFTGRPYAYYSTKASNNLPRVATEIGAAFHEIWWTDKRFAESRAVWR